MRETAAPDPDTIEKAGTALGFGRTIAHQAAPLDGRIGRTMRASPAIETKQKALHHQRFAPRELLGSPLTPSPRREATRSHELNPATRSSKKPKPQQTNEKRSDDQSRLPFSA